MGWVGASRKTREPETTHKRELVRIFPEALDSQFRKRTRAGQMRSDRDETMCFPQLDGTNAAFTSVGVDLFPLQSRLPCRNQLCAVPPEKDNTTRPSTTSQPENHRHTLGPELTSTGRRRLSLLLPINQPGLDVFTAMTADLGVGRILLQVDDRTARRGT